MERIVRWLDLSLSLRRGCLGVGCVYLVEWRSSAPGSPRSPCAGRVHARGAVDEHHRASAPLEQNTTYFFSRPRAVSLRLSALLRLIHASRNSAAARCTWVHGAVLLCVKYFTSLVTDCTWADVTRGRSLPWVLIEASPVVVLERLKLNLRASLIAPLGPPPGLAVARAAFSFFFLPSRSKRSFIQLCVAHIAHWSRARPFMLHRYRHFYCVALYCATLQRRESVS